MTSPRFSVIIPALNEEKTINVCIQAIKDNDYPTTQYEIVLADNGSVDTTVAIARSRNITVLECGRDKGVGVAAMRNIGAAATTGAVLVFVDADVQIPNNFFAVAARYFDDNFCGVLGFVDQPPKEACWVGRVWNTTQILKRPRVVSVDNLPGRNLLINRSVFELIKGFDSNLSAGEDKDFCLRVVRAGYDVLSLPSPKPIHLNCDPNLATFIRKEFWRQGTTLDIARNQGYSPRSLRNPLLSLYHLAWGMLFMLLLFFSSFEGWLSLVFCMWLLPATLIAVKTVRTRRSMVFLLQYLILTFLRWNTAGASLIHQVLKKNHCTSKQHPVGK